MIRKAKKAEESRRVTSNKTQTKPRDSKIAAPPLDLLYKSLVMSLEEYRYTHKF